MTDPAQSPETGARTEDGSPPGIPGWVKWPAIIIGVLIVVFVVLQLTGVGGDHGPGRHGPGGDTRPSGVTETQQQPGGGHTPPAGGH